MFFFGLAFIFSLGLFLQQFHWLAIGGANPNLAMVFFQLLAVIRLPFKTKAFSALLMAVVAWLIFDFWLIPLLALLVVFALSLALKKILTGKVFIDFSILLAAGTLIFYLISGFGNWRFFPWLAIIGEIAYGLAIGLWLLFIFNDKKEN